MTTTPDPGLELDYQWHGYAPGYYYTPEAPPPAPVDPYPADVVDTFTRADGPLSGSLTDSGHRWQDLTPSLGILNANVSGGKLRVSGPANSWQMFRLSDAPGDKPPDTTATVVTFTFELTADAAATCNLRFEPVYCPATNTAVVLAFGNNQAVFAYTGSTTLTNFATLQLSAPLVNGVPRRLGATYNKATGLLTLLDDGKRVSSATVPATPRAALTGPSRVRFGVGQNSTQVYTLDNVTTQDSDAYPTATADPVLADTPLVYWRLNEAAGAAQVANTAPAGGYVGTVVDVTLGATAQANTTAATITTADGPGAGYSRIWCPFTRNDSTFTVEGFFYVPTTATVFNLVGTYREPGGLGIRVYVNSSGGLVANFNNGAASITAGGNWRGAWHHFAYVKDAAAVRLYVDGVQQATAATTATIASTSTLSVFGMNDLAGVVGGLGSALGATMQRVAYFPTALSAARIAEHARFTVVTELVQPPAPPPVWVPPAYIADEDRSAALVSWSVAYGRDDANARCAPIQATIALDAPLAGPCPVGGDRVRLTLGEANPYALGLEEDERPRFTGEVTDADIDPARGLYTITAVGRLGRARRRTLDGRGWPRELDGPRVARILTLAAPDLAGDIDPGTAELIAATSSAQGAGALLDLVTDSTGGSLVEQPTGAVDWHDADHRRAAGVALTLTPAEILNEVKWSQHVGDIVNEVQVAYGAAGDKVTARDPNSIHDLEAFPTSITTALPDRSAAYDVGNLLVARRSLPRWQLPNLVVDLRATVTPAKAAALLALRHGDRIAVADLPAGGPYAGDVELFVEGIAETATRRAWTLAIAVSDPLLSGVGIRWKDIDPALTWDAVDPALTWLDVALLENPADLT